MSKTSKNFRRAPVPNLQCGAAKAIRKEARQLSRRVERRVTARKASTVSRSTKGSTTKMANAHSVTLDQELIAELTNPNRVFNLADNGIFSADNGTDMYEVYVGDVFVGEYTRELADLYLDAAYNVAWEAVYKCK